MAQVGSAERGTGEGEIGLTQFRHNSRVNFPQFQAQLRKSYDS